MIEAMHRLQLNEFQHWSESDPSRLPNQQVLVEAIKQVRNNLYTSATFQTLLQHEEFNALYNLYEEYRREAHGPMHVFWNSYLEMVSLLLDFIRATREGNWQLHLNCIKDILPWYFAYGHINYARYLPVYLADMLALEDTHPEAHNMLSNGDFGVQRTSSHGFSQVPVDQTIEQTLNTNTKNKGGIVGFSLKRGQ